MVYGLFLVISEVYLQIWYRYLTEGSQSKDSRGLATFCVAIKDLLWHCMYSLVSLRLNVKVTLCSNAFLPPVCYDTGCL
jgi:hypothetical protein